ncbi:hypothetical protein ACIBG4_06250 [Nonomuraea sp. NPDC050383]|uniref:hypothetical protein n=1 Tax=Nonomuraea sp. NPDC050383 TaxID=3364362 RepID=UPI0037A8E7C1
MRVSPRIVAAATAVLVAGGLLTAAPPANAATVTEFVYVVNNLSERLVVHVGETNATYGLAAGGEHWLNIRAPWVGNQGEMGKSITIQRGTRTIYWVFQDYWNAQDQIKFSTTNSYEQSVPVAGKSTGGGERRLTIVVNGSLFIDD